jgi:hypothetical protein
VAGQPRLPGRRLADRLRDAGRPRRWLLRSCPAWRMCSSARVLTNQQNRRQAEGGHRPTMGLYDPVDWLRDHRRRRGHARDGSHLGACLGGPPKCYAAGIAANAR